MRGKPRASDHRDQRDEPGSTDETEENGHAIPFSNARATLQTRGRSPRARCASVTATLVSPDGLPNWQANASMMRQ
jgi:hypothetical protein